MAEVRFVASSETKELTLVWSGLGKGRLHRYIVDVKLVRTMHSRQPSIHQNPTNPHRKQTNTIQVHRSALSRTLALLEAAFHLPRAGATHAALAQAKQRRSRHQLFHTTTTKKTKIPSPLEVAAHRPTTVTVIRHPHHLSEAVVPLALALPVPLSTATQRRLPTDPARARAKRPGQGKGRYGAPEETGVATSYAASLSAGLLPHLIHPPGRLVAALDALWPLLLWASFHAFLYYGACASCGIHPTPTHPPTHPRKTPLTNQTHHHTHIGLQSFPEFAVALDTMPLWGLSLGLGLVHLSLGLTLYALVTSKVR